MKHQLLVFASVGIIVFFALLNIDIPSLQGHGLTGQAVEEAESYPVMLNDVVRDFFAVGYVDFPSGGCGDVAASLYDNIFLTPLDATTGFATVGVDRLATVNFVIDRTERLGTLDMMSRSDGGENAVLNVNAEAVVNIPKQSRSTFVVMDLYGTTTDKFYVTKGRFSTPSLDCTFVTRNDQTVCDCKVHSITGIAVAGITSPTPPPEIYEFLQKRAEIGTTVK
ncbi:Uncharacterised protein [uncultured archaeon]|nr:Uncharacterised protein [uncultured archaeon]